MALTTTAITLTPGKLWGMRRMADARADSR